MLPTWDGVSDGYIIATVAIPLTGQSISEWPANQVFKVQSGQVLIVGDENSQAYIYDGSTFVTVAIEIPPDRITAGFIQLTGATASAGNVDRVAQINTDMIQYKV